MRLREEFGMTALGTIQANRKGLPKAITSTEGRPVGDYQVLYDESSNITIHSEICKSKSGTVKLHFISILIGFKNLVPIVIIRIRQMKKKTYYFCYPRCLQECPHDDVHSYFLCADNGRNAKALHHQLLQLHDGRH